MVETIGLVIITGYNAWQVADSLFNVRLLQDFIYQHGLYYNRFILACQVKF